MWVEHEWSDNCFEAYLIGFTAEHGAKGKFVSDCCLRVGNFEDLSGVGMSSVGGGNLQSFPKWKGLEKLNLDREPVSIINPWMLSKDVVSAVQYQVYF